MVITLVFIEDKILQLCVVFLLQNLYFGIQLTHVKAFSRKMRAMEWINFTFCLWVSYYQLLMLVVDNRRFVNISGWFFNGLFVLLVLINMGRECFFEFRRQVKRVRIKIQTQQIYSQQIEN